MISVPTELVRVHSAPARGGRVHSLPSDHGPFLNPPNLLTLSRLLLAGVVWVNPGDPLLVLGLTLVAGLTDLLDGWLARRLNLAPLTGRGSWLDPFCDKVFILSVLVAVWFARRPPIGLVLLIGARELVLIPAAAYYALAAGFRRERRVEFRAVWMGKAATAFQVAAIAGVLLDAPWTGPMALAAAVIGSLAGLHYVHRALLAGRRSKETMHAPSGRDL